jgi:hypothetical protein
MDDNGNAVITWRQFDDSNNNNHHIFKSEYRNGKWANPTLFTDHINPDGREAWNPQVAVDDNGNTVIVWYQEDSSGNNVQIFKSEYR